MYYTQNVIKSYSSDGSGNYERKRTSNFLFLFILFLCICTFNMSYGTRRTVYYRIWHRCQCCQWHWVEMKRVEELYYSSYIVLCILTLFFIFIFLRCVVNGFHDLKTLIYFLMRVNFYIFFLLQRFFYYDRLFIGIKEFIQSF